MERTLIADDKYLDKYVALKSYDDPTVVGVGKNPEEALRDAKKNGFPRPYLVFITEKEAAPIH